MVSRVEGLGSGGLTGPFKDTGTYLKGNLKVTYRIRPFGGFLEDIPGVRVPKL